MGSEVHLSWTPGSDEETPESGLTYNLRIGRTPQGNQVMPVMSASSGERRVIQPGNVGQNLSWSVNSLLDGTYYWSVQAIDHGMAASC